MDNKKLIKNFAMSTMSQVISLAVSFILGFIVPKFLSESQYAYWQTYVLYASYVSIFQFGILDGFILRYAQYDLEELDKTRVRSQFQALLIINCLISVIGIFVAMTFIDNIIYKWVMIFVSFSIVIKNLFAYSSYLLQCVNKIKQYASIIIVQRLIYAIIVVGLLFLNIKNFQMYCLADLLGDVGAIILSVIFNKCLFVGRGLGIKAALLETKNNIKAGVFLLIANLSGGLLIGSAKMVTQWRWDELVFGKVSFAFSLFGVFFSFILAISVVLFPSLKRLQQEELPILYKKIRDSLSPLLFILILFYFPLSWILEIWIPNYKISLIYLALILPLIIFTSKVSLLTNNYLKVYRKEKIMLIINIITLGVCFLACLASAYLFNSLDILIYSLLFVCMMRSIVSEIVVMRIIKQNAWFDFAIELIMTVIFVVAARYFSLWTGFLIYAVALAGYCILYRKNLAGIFRALKKKVKGKSGVINKE